MVVLLDHLENRGALAGVAAAGHRLVHGGSRYTEPQLVNGEVLAELRRLVPLDPDHLPAEIAMIEAVRRRRPALPQVACFDTAFHAAMPPLARLIPIPRRFHASGIRRYGFHGLSYEYLLEELARVAGVEAARQRVVLAHLGAGASLAATRDGRSVDTTMGFTPTAGMPMATRSGDLDPGVVLHLLRREGLSADQVDDLLNHRSGLLGISETSPDMRDLIAARERDPRAAEAVAFFCYQAKKWIGAYSSVLGGLDTLVFSGGIGEASAVVRAEICAGLEFLGIRLDEARNQSNADMISAQKSAVCVRVLKTNEELIVARATRRVLAAGTKGSEVTR